MPRPLATLLLLVTTLIWGFAFVAQKSGMASMGPLTFGAVRYLIGGLVILPIALREFRRRKVAFGRREWLLTLALSVSFFAGSMLQQTGLLITTVTNGGFLTALYVLFTPLLALVVLRSKPHPIVWVCVPLALVGTFYLNGGALDRFNFGDVLILLCAICWATHLLLLSHLVQRTSMPFFISAASFLFAGLLAAILAPIVEHPNLAGIAEGWVQLAYVSLLATAIAFTFQAIGQQYVPAANAAIILSSESLFAALGGALVLGERLPTIGYFGAALIFVSILLVETVPAYMARRRPESPPVASPPG